MKKAFIGSIIGASMTTADSLYHPSKSSVMNLNKMNFNKQVLQNREKGISVVQFYRSSEQASKDNRGQFEKFSIEHKAMMRVGAMDCEAQAVECKKQGIESQDLPLYRVFPPVPLPHVDYDGKPELDTDVLKRMAYRYIQSRVIEITANNIDTFSTGNPSKPKMLLFTEKKGTPIVYKALSTHFDKTLEFGLIRPSESSLVSKYAVTSYPTFILLKAEQKPRKYEGASYSYQDLFDFINVYSETFVFQGDEEPVESAATKPWLNENLPHLSKSSGNDICFKKDGTLCVIYVHGGKSDAIKEATLNNVNDNFAKAVTRGIRFSFMKLDLSKEAQFAAAFGVESEAFVVLNAGKRIRFLVIEGMTSESLQATLQVILDGDARFTIVKGNKLPELVTMHESYMPKAEL